MNKIKDLIKSLWQKFREKRHEYRAKELNNKADMLFDTSVYKGELWLTCDRSYIAPMRMFEKGKDQPSVIISVLRSMYVENHKEEYRV